MSVSSTLTLTLIEECIPQKFITALLESGWLIFRTNLGELDILSGPEDLSETTRVRFSDEELLKWAERRYEACEVVSAALIGPCGSGGTFVFFPDDPEKIHFYLEYNLKYLHQGG